MTAFGDKSRDAREQSAYRHATEADGRQVAPRSPSGAEIALGLDRTRKMLKRIVLEHRGRHGHHTADAAKRHFAVPLLATLRGLAADIIIFQAAILIAVYYFSTISPLDFLLNGRTSMQCIEAVPDQLAQRIDAGWPLRPTETRTSEICEVSRIGSGKQRYLQIDVASEPWDYVTPAQVLTIPVDADSNPVTKTIPGYTSLMSSIANTALIALAFAGFSANDRRTFGKAVFFLRVRSVDGKDPNFGTAFKREILKFSPNLLLSLVVFAISLFPVYPTEDFDALLGMFRNGYTPEDNGTAISYFIWTIAVMAWWGWPFIVWKGQTFYDRICTCKVVSA